MHEHNIGASLASPRVSQSSLYLFPDHCPSCGRLGSEGMLGATSSLGYATGQDDEPPDSSPQQRVRGRRLSSGSDGSSLDGPSSYAKSGSTIIPRASAPRLIRALRRVSTLTDLAPPPPPVPQVPAALATALTPRQRHHTTAWRARLVTCRSVPLPLSVLSHHRPPHTSGIFSWGNTE